MRSVLAVAAGYLVFGVSAVALFQLSGRDPHVAPGTGFAVFSVLYGVAFAGLGGYLAAALAKRNPLRHAALLALILALIAVVSLVARSGTGSVWSELATLLLMAPAALLGGFIERRRQARPGTAPPGA